MAAEKTPTVKRQRNSSPMYKDYQLLPPVLPILAGRSEALDALYAESEEMKLFHPHWAEQVGWDIDKMRLTEPKKLARIEDNIEASARLLREKNRFVGTVKDDPNAPAYRYAANLVMAAEAYKIPVRFLTAIMLKESTGYLNARSHVDAVGLMQIHYPAHSSKGEMCEGLTEAEVMHPQANIWFGSRLFAKHMKIDTREKELGGKNSLEARIRNALCAYVGDKSGKSPVAQEYMKTVFEFAQQWEGKAKTVAKERASGARTFRWQSLGEKWWFNEFINTHENAKSSTSVLPVFTDWEPTPKQEAALLAVRFPVIGNKVSQMANDGASRQAILDVKNSLEKKENELLAIGTPIEEIDKIFLRTDATKKIADQRTKALNKHSHTTIDKNGVSVDTALFAPLGIASTSLVTGLVLSHIMGSRTPMQPRIAASIAGTTATAAILAVAKERPKMKQQQNEEFSYELRNAISELFTGKPLPPEVKQSETAMLNYERCVREADYALRAVNMGIAPSEDVVGKNNAEFGRDLIDKLQKVKEAHENPEILQGPYRHPERTISAVRNEVGHAMRDRYNKHHLDNNAFSL